MKMILAFVCSIVCCLSANAQTTDQTRLDITTHSDDGVVVDYLCDGAEQHTLRGPEVIIDLPKGSDISIVTMEDSSLIGRYNEEDDSVTLKGDFEITVKEDGTPQSCLIVREATITTKKIDIQGKGESDGNRE